MDLEKPFITGFKATLGFYAAQAVLSIGIISFLGLVVIITALVLRS